MKTFMDENFMLNSKSAQRLYHEYAANMPLLITIIIYHHQIREYYFTTSHKSAVWRPLQMEGNARNGLRRRRDNRQKYRLTQNFEIGENLPYNLT